MRSRSILIQKWAFSLLFVINWIWACYLFFFHQNILQFDIAGHAESAATLARVGLHGFNDQMFLGTTHGLFYPPLEDFILATAHEITGASTFSLLPFYLSCITFFYFFSAGRILWRFRSSASAFLFGFGFLWIFNLDKAGAIGLQGLSLFDLVVVGLSSQLLAGVGMLELFRMAQAEQKPSRRRLMFWTLFTGLSHIVMGVLAVCLFAYLQVKRGRGLKEFLKDLMIMFGLSAFYVVPFLMYRSWSTSSSIYFPPSGWIFVLGGLSFGLISFLKGEHPGLFGLSLLFLSSVTLLYGVDRFFNANIPFHFYRFQIISLIVYFMAACFELDARSKNRWSVYAKRSMVIVFLGVLGATTRPWIPELQEDYLKKTEIKIEPSSALNLRTYGRFWVVGQSGASDMGLDSYLMERDPKFHSTKGLYWESGYSNSIQSSYLASLVGLPIVLDYLAESELSCEAQKMLIDQFAILYNVKGMIASPRNLWHFRPGRKECWEQILHLGTQSYRLIEHGKVFLNGWDQSIFELQFRIPTVIRNGMTHQVLNFIPASMIHFPTRAGKFPYFGEVVRANFVAGKNGWLTPPVIYALPEDREQFLAMKHKWGEGSVVGGAGELVERGVGEYEIQLPPEPTWFWLKLAPQPGLKIFDEKEREISYVKGMPGVIGVGTGKLRVVFQRTPLMCFSYLGSLGFLFAILCNPLRRVLKENRRWADFKGKIRAGGKG